METRQKQTKFIIKIKTKHYEPKQFNTNEIGHEKLKWGIMNKNDAKHTKLTMKNLNGAKQGKTNYNLKMRYHKPEQNKAYL